MTATPAIATIAEGFRTSREYAISPAVYERFLDAYADTNPLHVDDEFARRCGFPERVMHGAILNGFISHFVGVHFPGTGAVLHAVSVQFKTPCHLGDRVRIDATVSQVAAAVATLAMDLVVTNLTRGRVAAKAKVQVGLP